MKIQTLIIKFTRIKELQFKDDPRRKVICLSHGIRIRESLCSKKSLKHIIFFFLLQRENQNVSFDVCTLKTSCHMLFKYAFIAWFWNNNCFENVTSCMFKSHVSTSIKGTFTVTVQTLVFYNPLCIQRANLISRQR